MIKQIKTILIQILTNENQKVMSPIRPFVGRFAFETWNVFFSCRHVSAWQRSMMTIDIIGSCPGPADIVCRILAMFHP